MSFEIIVGIPLLIEATILCIQNILEVPLEDIGILKMESIFLHTNIEIYYSSFRFHMFRSYYTINPCISASITFDDCFSIFMLSFYTTCDSILLNSMW